MKLTHALLNEEYVAWNIKNSDGRDNDDLRFGQYLCNRYDILGNFTDVFNFESAEKTYSTLLKEINESEKED